MPVTVIDHQRRFYRQHDAFVEQDNPVQPNAHWLSCEIATEAGHGWMDTGLIAHGLSIGRAHYHLHASWQCDYQQPLDSGWSLYCLLSGQARVTLAGEPHAQTLAGGALYVCDHACTPSQMRFEQAATTLFAGLSLTIPPALWNELIADAPTATTIGGQRPGYLPLPRQHPLYAHAMQIARQGLNASATTSMGRLHLEAQALELTAILAGHIHADITGNGRTARLPHRHHVAVEEVLEIFEREWMSAHTITTLARRVHLNECYLKTAFRQFTGQTVAHYLRRVRMRHARRLIEDSRTSVLHAAAFVGYSNPSHFARAFKAVYGIAPSLLKSSAVTDRN